MLKGMGISDGIGIGKAIILNNEDIKPEKIRTDDIEQEKKIFLKHIDHRSHGYINVFFPL